MVESYKQNKDVQRDNKNSFLRKVKEHATVGVMSAALAVSPAFLTGCNLHNGFGNQNNPISYPSPSPSPSFSPLQIASPAPSNQGINQGNIATIIDAGASGGQSPYAYQWLEMQPYANSYSNATDCVSPNSTICTFQTNSSTPLGNYSFQLAAQDSEYQPMTVISNSAFVSVNPISYTSLQIASPLPSNQSVTQENTAIITDAGASGGQSPYSYQWKEMQPSATSYTNATDCLNPTSTTCTFITISTTTPGNYSFQLAVQDSENPPMTTVSNSAVITVNPISYNSLQIASPLPQSQSVNAGNTATITDAGASGGQSPYAYQWLEQKPGTNSYVNATDCAIPTSATCIFPTTSATALGTYNFQLAAQDSENPPMKVQSNAASITVNGNENCLFALIRGGADNVAAVCGDQLIATFNTGGTGYSIVSNTNGPYVYFGQTNSQSVPEVALINPSTNAISSTFQLSVLPNVMAITPGDSNLFVAASGALPGQQNMNILIPSNGSFSTLSLPDAPISIAFNTGASNAYASSGPNSTEISVVNTLTAQLTQAIPASNAAYVAITPNNAQAYASMPGEVQIIDLATTSVLATIPLPNNPVSATGQVVFTPDGTKAYAGNSNGITVIDTASMQQIAQIPGNTLTENIAISPDGKYVYAPSISTQSNLGVVLNIIEVSNNSIATTIPLVSILNNAVGVVGFNQIGFSKDGSEAYIVGGQGNTYLSDLYIIDTASQALKTIVPLPGDSSQITAIQAQSPQ